MTSRIPETLPGRLESNGAPSDPFRIKMFCLNHLRISWQGHIVFGIAQAIFDEGVDIEVWGRSAEAAARRPYVRLGVPGYVAKVLYKLRQEPLIDRLTVRRFLGSLRKGDIVYAWPMAPLDMLREVKARGHLLLIEALNSAQPTYQRILTDAYRRLGEHRHTSDEPDAIERERERFQLADRVFTASPLTTQSYIEAGIREDHILESFYGWEPDRFRGTVRALPPADGLTVLFVGTPIVRKGVHLLLQAWDRANIPGRLVVVGGRPEPIIAERFPQYLNRPDIQWLSWSNDVGEFFRSADVFAFPSLEEGSPLVIYEAMGCGLPAVASPMGGGAIGWQGEGIIILDPYDVDAWAETFRRLGTDHAYRRELAEQARRSAQNFTWKAVGLKRLSQITSLVRSMGCHDATHRA